MNITINIDRLTLDGFDLLPAQRAQFAHAFRHELTLLFLQRGSEFAAGNGGSVPSVRAPAMTLPSDASPAQLGAHAARSVFEGMHG